MKTMALAVAVAVAGCGAYPDHWTVEGDGPANALEIAGAVKAEAPCDVEQNGIPWGGSIRFYPADYSLTCDSVPDALGCAWRDADGAHVAVVAKPWPGSTESTLVHELGHIAWSRCGLESASHPFAFLYWVQMVTWDVT